MARRNEIATEDRRRQVSYLMLTLHNPTTRRITEALAKLNPPINSSKSTVHRDIQTVRSEWREDRLRNMDEVIGSEAAKLSLAEEQAWAALAKSRQPLTKTRIVTRQVPFGNEGRTVTQTTTTTETVERAADPRYLRALVDIQERRANLLGLDKPKGLDLTSGGKAMAFECAPGFGDWKAPQHTFEEREEIERLRQEIAQLDNG